VESNNKIRDFSVFTELTKKKKAALLRGGNGAAYNVDVC